LPWCGNIERIVAERDKRIAADVVIQQQSAENTTLKKQLEFLDNAHQRRDKQTADQIEALTAERNTQGKLLRSAPCSKADHSSERRNGGLSAQVEQLSTLNKMQAKELQGSGCLA